MRKVRFKQMKRCRREGALKPLSMFNTLFYFDFRDEIGLIPCPEARYNRSPIVLVENKLGVESWCVKFLLPYVHNKLLLYRQRKQWLDREGKVMSYLNITLPLVIPSQSKDVKMMLRTEDLIGALSLHSSALVDITSTVLLINPDFTTAWNVR